MTLKGRHFLKLLDFKKEEILYFLELAAKFKKEKQGLISHKICAGKNIVLIFEKTSTRTRCAFEVAAHDLGMNVTYLDSYQSQIGEKESIADTARVLSRMFDGIEYRGFKQKTVEFFAENSSVPVYNGLTNESHPTQVLADFLTIKEKMGSLSGQKIVFIGDARFNMANSLMVGCAKLGISFVACAPKEYFPDPTLISKCKQIASESGATLDFIEDPLKATKNADIIYTDIWVSMGEKENLWEKRIKDLTPYKVTKDLMKNANDKCVFMHCLPSFHNTQTHIGKKIYEKFGITSMEVTDDVFSCKNSVVFDQAENRMHTIKAVLAATLL